MFLIPQKLVDKATPYLVTKVTAAAAETRLIKVKGQVSPRQTSLIQTYTQTDTDRFNSTDIHTVKNVCGTVCVYVYACVGASVCLYVLAYQCLHFRELSLAQTHSASSSLTVTAPPDGSVVGVVLGGASQEQLQQLDQLLAELGSLHTSTHMYTETGLPPPMLYTWVIVH